MCTKNKLTENYDSDDDDDGDDNDNNSYEMYDKLNASKYIKDDTRQLKKSRYE